MSRVTPSMILHVWGLGQRAEEISCSDLTSFQDCPLAEGVETLKTYLNYLSSIANDLKSHRN